LENDEEKERTKPDIKKRAPSNIEREKSVNTMTTVTIKFFATFREITGKREQNMELHEKETTILDVLNQLSDEYGRDFKEYIFEPSARKSLRPQISVIVNGQSVRNLEKLRTRIKDGDTIAILPPISGG
jgi:MoaD family protein